MDKDLRILAGEIVVESKLSKPAKLQLLNFIKEQATDSQTKALLLDGDIIKLDEESEKIINQRFEVSEIGKHLNEGGFKTIFGMFLLGPYGWAAYRAIRAFANEKSRKCGTFGIGRTRDVCLWKLRAEEATKMAALIAKEMKNCSQSKNPDKCKKAGQAKIMKYQAKAKQQMDKIKKFGTKSPKKNIKAKAGLEKAASKEDKWV